MTAETYTVETTGPRDGKIRRVSGLTETQARIHVAVAGAQGVPVTTTPQLPR